METNKQVIVGENNLPELIQDKNDIVIGTLKAKEKSRVLNDFNNQMKKAAESFTKTAELAEKIFPKNLGL